MLDAATVAVLQGIIASQGEPITFVDPQLGTLANEWQVDDAMDMETAGQAYICPVDNRRVDETTIRATDSIAYLHAPDAPMGFRDDWQIRRNSDNVEFQIVDLTTYRSGGADVLHEVIIRT